MFNRPSAAGYGLQAPPDWLAAYTRHGPAITGVDVPQPPPDIVPTPSPHPVPPPPPLPPEINEPPMPDQHPPVRDPYEPGQEVRWLNNRVWC